MGSTPAPLKLTEEPVTVSSSSLSSFASTNSKKKAQFSSSSNVLFSSATVTSLSSSSSSSTTISRKERQNPIEALLKLKSVDGQVKSTDMSQINTSTSPSLSSAPSSSLRLSSSLQKEKTDSLKRSPPSVNLENSKKKKVSHDPDDRVTSGITDVDDDNESFECSDSDEDDVPIARRHQHRQLKRLYIRKEICLVGRNLDPKQCAIPTSVKSSGLLQQFDDKDNCNDKEDVKLQQSNSNEPAEELSDPFEVSDNEEIIILDSDIEIANNQLQVKKEKNSVCHHCQCVRSGRTLISCDSEIPQSTTSTPSTKTTSSSSVDLTRDDHQTSSSPSTAASSSDSNGKEDFKSLSAEVSQTAPVEMKMCGLKYCKLCLKEHYPTSNWKDKDTDTKWKCPFCCGKCNCLKCVRKRIKLGQLKRDMNGDNNLTTSGSITNGSLTSMSNTHPASQHISIITKQNVNQFGQVVSVTTFNQQDLHEVEANRSLDGDLSGSDSYVVRTRETRKQIRASYRSKLKTLSESDVKLIDPHPQDPVPEKPFPLTRLTTIPLVKALHIFEMEEGGKKQQRTRRNYECVLDAFKEFCEEYGWKALGKKKIEGEKFVTKYDCSHIRLLNNKFQRLTETLFSAVTKRQACFSVMRKFVDFCDPAKLEVRAKKVKCLKDRKNSQYMFCSAINEYHLKHQDEDIDPCSEVMSDIEEPLTSADNQLGSTIGPSISSSGGVPMIPGFIPPPMDNSSLNRPPPPSGSSSGGIRNLTSGMLHLGTQPTSGTVTLC